MTTKSPFESPNDALYRYHGLWHDAQAENERAGGFNADMARRALIMARLFDFLLDNYQSEAEAVVLELPVAPELPPTDLAHTA